MIWIFFLKSAFHEKYSEYEMNKISSYQKDISYNQIYLIISIILMILDTDWHIRRIWSIYENKLDTEKIARIILIYLHTMWSINSW